jgi:esterase/lipase
MSEWQKKPSISNESKDLIDNLFEIQDQEKKAKQDDPPEVKKYKVKIPEPPEQTKKDEEIALKLAKDEMEQIRKTFLDFTDQCNDTVIYSYLYPYVQDFVEKCRQMQVLIENEIDEDKLTDNGLHDYEQMKKIRGTVLSMILDKHNKQ